MSVRAWTLAAVRMAQLGIRRREPALVHWDAGVAGWRHRYKAGVLYTPELRGRTWRRCEADTLDVFCHKYHPGSGDVIIELGAGCGTETVTLSRLVGPAGRVVAVEASPRAADLLRATVSANDLSNVTVVEAAISDSCGFVEISDRGGVGGIQNSILNARGGHRVRSLTLDTLVAEVGLGDVDLLKVNIEGAERLMIRGMAESVSRVQNAVVSCHDFITEATGESDFATHAEVVAYFESCGFEVVGRRDPRPWVRFYVYAAKSPIPR